jgi:tartrate-resistant acid phosphatase type 5
VFRGQVPDGGRAVRDAGRDVAPVCPQEIDAGFQPDRLATRFAAIGDYGWPDGGERLVASLIASWRPDFVITLGDNNYPLGEQATIDDNIGQFFHSFIGGYAGRFGCGARENRFFPALGNHDWYTFGAQPYLDYFQLPGNERYYEVMRGDVHLFSIDSDFSEPDGVTSDSVQASWLRGALAASTARWRIVYMHHPPYSSASHGPSVYMQWPYKAWGASLVLAGHDHSYERLVVDGLPYIVAGLGGAPPYPFGPPLPGSEFQFTNDFGALLIDADATQLRVRFHTAGGELIDQFVLQGDS